MTDPAQREALKLEGIIGSTRDFGLPLKLDTKAFERGMIDTTIRLTQFIQRCAQAGVITERQRADLEGVCHKTPPERILHVLTRKR